MIPWYAPTGLKDHIRRLFALRCALVLTAFVAVVVTELRFDWIETAVGAYLVSTNPYRPESGAVWDQGHKSDLARKTLSEFRQSRSGMEREVRRATSIGQVVAGIDAERGAMISADHFVELYQKLPPVLSREIISAYTLLTLKSGLQWKRTFFEQQGGEQLQVYLLDDHNQVLHRLSLGSDLVEHIQRGEVAIHTQLDKLGDFSEHIYPAKQFFAALNSLSEETKKGIVDTPGDLLAASGRIVRVGISSQPIAQNVDIGFEIEDAKGVKVVLIQAVASDVQKLVWILEDPSRNLQQDLEGG